MCAILCYLKNVFCALYIQDETLLLQSNMKIMACKVWQKKVYQHVLSELVMPFSWDTGRNWDKKDRTSDMKAGKNRKARKLDIKKDSKFKLLDLNKF